MPPIRRCVPVLVVLAYGLFYAWSWYYVWRLHQTDPGDGLEYMGVFSSTLPWCIVGAPLAANLPESAFPFFLTTCAVVNAALLWCASLLLIDSFTQDQSRDPDS